MLHNSLSIFIRVVVSFYAEFPAMSVNGLGLCEEADLKAQTFGLAQIFIKIHNVNLALNPLFCKTPCCAFVLSTFNYSGYLMLYVLLICLSKLSDILCIFFIV